MYHWSGAIRRVQCWLPTIPLFYQTSQSEDDTNYWDITLNFQDHSLPFDIALSASDGSFTTIGDVNQLLQFTNEQERDCIRKNDILLEVCHVRVSGLCRQRTLDLLRHFAADSQLMEFCVVRSDYLRVQLSDYLAVQYEPVSLDHDLQTTIRSNVYLHTVPYTTRIRREQEQNNREYRFVTFGEFRQLKESGQLLESGVYNGNFYGTPKPVEPSAAASPSSTASSFSTHLKVSQSPRSTSSHGAATVTPTEQPTTLAQIGHRKSIEVALHQPEQEQPVERFIDDDNSSLVVQQEQPSGVMAPLFPPKPIDNNNHEQYTSGNSAAGNSVNYMNLPNGGNSHHSNMMMQQQGPSNGQQVWTQQTEPTGSLPSNWEVAYTEFGEKYFIDHNSGTTHWTDPRLDEAGVHRPSMSDSLASSESAADDYPLPPGWERVDDPQYGRFYVDHVHKRTQYERPSTAAGGGLMSNGAHAHADYATTANAAVVHGQSNIGQNGLLGRRTGSVPDMFPNNTRQQQHIESVHAGLFTRQPSELRGELLDTTLVKSERGLGFTLIGNDSGTHTEEFLQIKAIIPGGAAFQDGRLRMGDILVYINDECVLGCTQEDAIDIFKSISPGQPVYLQVCRGYPLLFDPHTEIITRDPYSLQDQQVASTSNANLQPQYLTLNIVKGNEGFGFTIADSSGGQKVKKILYPSRCPGLHEGDVLCEINTVNVRKMAHTQIVDVLRDCPVGQQAVLIVQRAMAHSLPPLPGKTAIRQPPAVAPKPRMRPGMNQHQPRPHSSYMQYGNNNAPDMINDRRSKTPSAEFTYQNGAAGPTQVFSSNSVIPRAQSVPANGHGQIIQQNTQNMYNNAPKPRSRTPGNAPQRPNMGKPAYYTNAGGRQGGQQPPEYLEGGYDVGGGAMEGVPIYENLPGQQQRQSRMDMGRAIQANSFTTPNYVPASVYNANQQPVPNGHTNGGRAQSQSRIAGYETITVNLLRQPTGFGFRVVGGTEEGTPIRVGLIIPGGAAEADSRLMQDDEIAEIDGTSVLGGRHQLAVQLMQRAAQNSRVKLAVRRPLKELPRSMSMPQQLPVDPTAYPYTVHVQRHDDEGFGFVIISSVNKNGSTIGRIIDNSPAVRCGRLRVGDRIVAVNGVDITQMHHGEIVNLIKESGLNVQLTVDVPLPTDNLIQPNTEYYSDSGFNSVSQTQTLNQQAQQPQQHHMDHSNTMPLERQNSFGSVLDELQNIGNEDGQELLEGWHDISVSDPPSPTNNRSAGNQRNPDPDYLYMESLLEYGRRYGTPRKQTSGAAQMKPAGAGQTSDFDYYAVELHRGSKGFGFSIRGGQEFGQMPLFVLKIADGGPADADGRLRVGDELVEINGLSTHGMTHEQAIQLIRRDLNKVKLLLRRNNHPTALAPDQTVQRKDNE